MKDINIEKLLNDPNYLYKKGHIVWVNFPNNEDTGSIQKGLRKALIYSNDINNIYSTVLHVIPMTTKNKKFKLHLHRDNSRDFFCPEQLQLINKDWVVKESGYETITKDQLKMVDDLIDVQMGRKSYNDIRNNLGRGNKNEKC